MLMICESCGFISFDSTTVYCCRRSKLSQASFWDFRPFVVVPSKCIVHTFCLLKYDGVYYLASSPFGFKPGSILTHPAQITCTFGTWLEVGSFLYYQIYDFGKPRYGSTHSDQWTCFIYLLEIGLKEYDHWPTCLSTVICSYL